MFKESTFVLVFLLLGTSCGNTEKPTTKEPDTQKEEVAVASTAVKVENALSFINGYVENSNNMNEAMNIIDFTNSNNLTTETFKSTLEKIIETALKENPEMGLDADPIYDAQDYPEKGFELESIDEKTNYLIVNGITELSAVNSAFFGKILNIPRYTIHYHWKYNLHFWLSFKQN